MKGWKSRFFFIRCLSSFLFYYFHFCPSTQPDLPKGYKFEDPYTRSLELVEGKKILSTDLIAEELLLAQWLSVRVEDPDVQMIDKYDDQDTQPGKFSSLLFYF